MTYAKQTKFADCAESYDKLESTLRQRLTDSASKYREVAAEIGIGHSKLWLFHKQNCKLRFVHLDKLALMFDVPYYLANIAKNSDLPKASTVDALDRDVREAVGKASDANISYRAIGEAAGISHEWVRCFHIKNSTIDTRKLLSLADYLGVPFELCNADKLLNKR